MKEMDKQSRMEKRRNFNNDKKVKKMTYGQTKTHSHVAGRKTKYKKESSIFVLPNFLLFCNDFHLSANTFGSIFLTKIKQLR